MKDETGQCCASTDMQLQYPAAGAASRHSAAAKNPRKSPSLPATPPAEVVKYFQKSTEVGYTV